MLLIYPYWNVNCVSWFAIAIIHSLLIYPYWNVNKNNTDIAEKQKEITDINTFEQNYKGNSAELDKKISLLE